MKNVFGVLLVSIVAVACGGNTDGPRGSEYPHLDMDLDPGIRINMTVEPDENVPTYQEADFKRSMIGLFNVEVHLRTNGYRVRWSKKDDETLTVFWDDRDYQQWKKDISAEKGYPEWALKSQIKALDDYANAIQTFIDKWSVPHNLAMEDGRVEVRYMDAKSKIKLEKTIELAEGQSEIVNLFLINAEKRRF